MRGLPFTSAHSGQIHSYLSPLDFLAVVTVRFSKTQYCTVCVCVSKQKYHFLFTVWSVEYDNFMVSLHTSSSLLWFLEHPAGLCYELQSGLNLYVHNMNGRSRVHHFRNSLLVMILIRLVALDLMSAFNLGWSSLHVLVLSRLPSLEEWAQDQHWTSEYNPEASLGYWSTGLERRLGVIHLLLKRLSILCEEWKLTL